MQYAKRGPVDRERVRDVGPIVRRRIHQALPPGSESGFRISPGRLVVNCISVKILIRAAYVVMADTSAKTVFTPDPISGGPEWMKSTSYHIEAKAAGNPTIQMMKGPMLQALLEDRFKLKIHRETKEIPVYELQVAKQGFQLQPLGECVRNSGDETQPPPPDDARDPTAFFKFCAMDFWRRLPGKDGVPFMGNWSAEIRGTLDQVSKRLSAVLDRPVINKTGIAGAYAVKVEFAPDGSVPGLLPGGVRRYRLLDEPPLPDEITALPTTPTGASIFTAIQEQAGLRLVGAKGLGVVVVVDVVERPSEN